MRVPVYSRALKVRGNCPCLRLFKWEYGKCFRRAAESDTRAACGPHQRHVSGRPTRLSANGDLPLFKTKHVMPVAVLVRLRQRNFLHHFHRRRHAQPSCWRGVPVVQLISPMIRTGSPGLEMSSRYIRCYSRRRDAWIISNQKLAVAAAAGSNAVNCVPRSNRKCWLYYGGLGCESGSDSGWL